MKKIKLNDLDYEIIEDYKNGFDLEEVTLRAFDYFNDYNYIFGDWSYGKLRLKGYCDKNNKIFKPVNDIKTLKDYIKNNCAYDCKYFLIKKL